MIVQIYEVQSPEEARALLDVGVTHIGVLVGEGAFPRELSAAAARRIFAAVAGRGTAVALSLAPDVETVARVAQETAPDVLHVGAAPELLSVDDCRALREDLSCRIMRAIPVTGPEAVDLARSCAGAADCLLLDSHEPGDRQIGAQGRTHDWSVSAAIVAAVDVPVILAGGLGPENVADAIRRVRPAGVDSKTLTDRADGTGKDIETVERFVRAAVSSGSGSVP